MDILWFTFKVLVGGIGLGLMGSLGVYVFFRLASLAIMNSREQVNRNKRVTKLRRT